MNEQIPILLCKHLAGTLTDEERARLNEWRRASEANGQVFRHLNDTHWIDTQLRVRRMIDHRRPLADTEARINGERSAVIGRRLAFKWMAAAACLLLLMGGAWLLWQSKETAPTEIVAQTDIRHGHTQATLTLPSGETQELDATSPLNSPKGGAYISPPLGGNEGGCSDLVLSTPRGGEFRVVLEDGTEVWLNADTRLTYPEVFQGEERRVELSGEAYFKVATDSLRPFYVLSGGQEVRVYGTEFNIHAYQDEPLIQTTLVEGSISLRPVAAGERELMLTPGHQAIYDTRESTANVRTVDTDVVTSWRTGTFVFEDQTLEQIMHTLSRWYDFESQTARAQKTYDVQYKDTPIEQVIKDLRQKTGYQFVYKKETLQTGLHVTCSYKKATLQQLLDRIFYEEAGLDYEISNGTVILRKAAADRPYFKRIVTGVVTDQQDEPLAGATVLLRDTHTGVVTDLEGAFSIMVEGKDATLDISYLGMKPVAVKISSRTEKFVTVKMASDEKLLEEVLVTGYQNIKRENATGAYQLISSRNLDQRYTGDVASNLEGKIPGLVSYNNGFNEGGESAITIRGTGSFNATTSPLIVVDGLPVEGGLGSVNPYNIENITVLKDAAAASIYGARASNGVIVITTKQAKSDRLEISLSADLTFSEKNDYGYMRWADARQLIELEQNNFQFVKNHPGRSAYQNLQNYYQTRPQALSPIVRLLMAREMGDLSAADLENQLSLLGQNDYRREWQDVWEQSQVVQQYNLSLAGRGKYVTSSVVLNYKGDNVGVNNEYNRELTFSYRGDTNSARWLSVQFGANVINGRQTCC